MVFIVLVLLVFVGGCTFSSSVTPEPPGSFLLSWQQDPATTMTIDWHPEADAHSWLEYRKRGEDEWIFAEGASLTIPGSPRRLMREELTGLEPQSYYEFRFSGADPVYSFRTMPRQADRPIRFIAGGDVMHHRQWMQRTAEAAMQVTGEEADFAVLGGDLAYADGLARKAFRWFDYFEVWSETMITPTGRVIPHIAAIGNHEVVEQFVYRYPAAEYERPDFALREAPYFSRFIPFPGAQGYGVLDFGEYLSLFILDSGHLNFIEGRQTEWLEYELSRRPDTRHIIPVYHVPAWPSFRDKDSFLSRTVREQWVPRFEDHGVRLALEHHDHTFKRTHPIRNNQIDETGIYYVGDGAWGVRLRQPRTDEEGNLPWYIAKADSVFNFAVVEIDGDDLRVEMFDEGARLLDRFEITGAGRTEPVIRAERAK
ncbi:metallophosphoesterase family protein [Balneolales bacterium ANBcel1]|nr:metallophosphoesterase family protein [Balneolales bacterium ANBcel1]